MYNCAKTWHKIVNFKAQFQWSAAKILEICIRPRITKRGRFEFRQENKYRFQYWVSWTLQWWNVAGSHLLDVECGDAFVSKNLSKPPQNCLKPSQNRLKPLQTLSKRAQIAQKQTQSPSKRAQTPSKPPPNGTQTETKKHPRFRHLTAPLGEQALHCREIHSPSHTFDQRAKTGSRPAPTSRSPLWPWLSPHHNPWRGAQQRGTVESLLRLDLIK